MCLHFILFIFNALQDCTDHLQIIKIIGIKYYSPDGLSVTCTDSQIYYLLAYNEQLANYKTY